MSIDTGHGDTITFGTSALAFNWESIDAGQKTKAAVATSHLGTTGSMTFMPGDLTDEGEITLVGQCDDTLAEPDNGSAAETITLTRAGGATLAGTGFINRVKRASSQTGQLKKYEITVKWDGETGPTFTPQV